MQATRENLLGALPAFKDQWILIHPKQSVKDIIREVLESHQEFAPLYDRIALYFDADSIEEICTNIYDFLKKNIRYKEEKEEDQTTATPAGILSRCYGDCKHYSTFAGGVLDGIKRLTGKNIKWNYRFASYDPFNKSPHHVFTVVHDGPDEIWIDPTPGSDHNEPVWQVDKKVSTMALRRNIAGIGILQPISTSVEIEDPNVIRVAPDKLPLTYNEVFSDDYVTALEEQQVDEEITPELQNAIEVLMHYGIMNDKGEISDAVLNKIAPTLSPDEFETITNARHQILVELQKAVTIGSFLSTLWNGVKKVSLAFPRNAYLSLVYFNAFGYATKLHNAIYKEDGTYWQPGQQQLYNKWKKLGGTWTNLRNAIDAGAKKKAILGALEIIDYNSIDPDCLDEYFINSTNGFSYDGSAAIGIVPAAVAAWATAAGAIIAALMPLIKTILQQRASMQQLPSNIDPNTGLPVGVNPGANTGSGNFMDNIKEWIQSNPLPAAGIAAAGVYLVTHKGKIGAAKKRGKSNLLLVAGVGIGGYLLLKGSSSNVPVLETPPADQTPVDSGALPNVTTDTTTPVTPTRTGFLFVRDLLPYYSTVFDPQAYLNRYPDVRADKVFSQDPYSHYQKYGQYEGRLPSADPSNVRYDSAFDAVYYGDRYPDIPLHYGTNYNQYYQHWLQYGQREGRKPGGAYLITQ